MRIVPAVAWLTVWVAASALAQTTSTSTSVTVTTSSSNSSSSTSTSTGVSTTATSSSSTSTSSSTMPVPCSDDCLQVDAKEECRSCCSSCFDDQIEACMDAGSSVDPSLCDGCDEAECCDRDDPECPRKERKVFTWDEFVERWKTAGNDYRACVSDPDGVPGLFDRFAPSSCRRRRDLQGSCFKVAGRNAQRCSIVQTCVECCSEQLVRHRRYLMAQLKRASVRAARINGDSVPETRRACRSVLQCVEQARRTAGRCRAACDRPPNCQADLVDECIDSVPPPRPSAKDLRFCYGQCADKCGANSDAYVQCLRACRDLHCDALEAKAEEEGSACWQLDQSSLLSSQTTTVAVTEPPFCLNGNGDPLACTQLPSTTRTTTSTSTTTSSSTSTTIIRAVDRTIGGRSRGSES